MLKQHARKVAVAVGFTDFVAIALALPASYWLAGHFKVGALRPLAPMSSYLSLLPIAGLIWLISLATLGAYRSHRRLSIRAEIGELIVATLIAALLISSILFLTRVDRILLDGVELSRRLLVLWVGVGLAFLAVARAAIRSAAYWSRRHGWNYRNVLILGTGNDATTAARELKAHAHWGFRILAQLPFDEQQPRVCRSGAGSVLASVKGLDQVLQEETIDEVILAPDKDFESWYSLATELQQRGMMVSVVGPRGVFAAPLPVSSIGPLHVFQFNAAPRRPLALATKRLADVIASLTLLIALAPLLALIALLIAAMSGLPILFTQTRVGLNGRRFTMFKFRTMVPSSAARLRELLVHNQTSGPVFKLHNDPRVTRIGSFLRRFSLDELPQLINVLLGHMSLVGPRPPIPEEVAQYEPSSRRRLAMRPGMTGLWQVSGRSNLDFETWVNLDLSYIDKWSPWLDTLILAKTIPAVILGRGAY